MITLLQFTDLHLHDDPNTMWRGLKPQQTFEQALYHARRNHWPPQGILLTGDLGNDEHGASYDRLAQLAASWSLPFIVIPGNHDNPERIVQAFSDAGEVLPEWIDFDGWRIVGLDSRLAGAVQGRLSDAQQDRLERASATRGERHLLVTLHHPPLDVGSRWVDRLKLEDADGFRQRLHDLHVSVCVFGHVHQAWDSRDDGIRYLGTPSTSRQFLPNSDMFAEDTRPPAYRVLRLADSGTVDSEIEWLSN